MDFNEIARRFEVRKLSFENPVKSFNCGDVDLTSQKALSGIGE